jgi:putative phosphoesterase
MKIGVIGDIHGNFDALKSVLASARREKVDLILNTGDLIGYYFQPKKVVDALDGFNCINVKGNHEQMLAISAVDKNYLHNITERYGCGIKRALDQLDANQINTLINLPQRRSLVFKGCKILLCHGSPFSLDEYIYPDTPVTDRLLELSEQFDFIITGHTHYPQIKKLSHNSTLLNPGSVGQPRNRQSGAHWATIDVVTKKTTLLVEVYNVSKLLRDCKKLHPEISYLREVFTRL